MKFTWSTQKLCKGSNGRELLPVLDSFSIVGYLWQPNLNPYDKGQKLGSKATIQNTEGLLYMFREQTSPSPAQHLQTINKAVKTNMRFPSWV